MMGALEFWEHIVGYLLQYEPLAIHLERLTGVQVKPFCLSCVTSVSVIPWDSDDPMVADGFHNNWVLLGAGWATPLSLKTLEALGLSLNLLTTDTVGAGDLVDQLASWEGIRLCGELFEHRRGRPE